MSSFTTVPILKMHGKYTWEVFTPFTYVREPLLDKDGKVKPLSEYTDEERELYAIDLYTDEKGEVVNSDKIVVPAGFITDLASTPRFIWSLLPPHGDYAKAAILHDYLYSKGSVSVTRKAADFIFYEAMGVLGVAEWKRKLIYHTVRMFGGKHFRK